MRGQGQGTQGGTAMEVSAGAGGVVWVLLWQGFRAGH